MQQELSEEKHNVKFLKMSDLGTPEEHRSAEVDCYFASDINPPIDEDGEALDEAKTIDDYLYNDFGIFKLTPRECGRLMNVADRDIDKILSVNSNSQAYKQFGNSIVVAVLIAIFSQFNFKGIKPWNELTDDERYELIYKGCVLYECKE